jgi:hypothetical protein
LFEDSRAEIEAAWEQTKKDRLQLLAMLDLELFSYYDSIARDRFYALREWTVLKHIFTKGIRMVHALTWDEAATIASDLRDDTNGAIERSELSAKVFRRCGRKSRGMVRKRFSWAIKQKNPPAADIKKQA